jgi:hypothetical protein
MKTLRYLTLAAAALLAIGEIARWWGDPRLVPLAFDELAVAAAMLGGVLAQRRFGTAPLAAAWGAFCGLVLSLLVPTLDHLLYGPEKDSAAFYAAILSIMIVAGLWAAFRATALAKDTP